MTPVIRAASSPGEVRVALLHNDILIDYAIWRPGAPDGVGDIHRGRITRQVPAMAGAFVALGGAEGFLPGTEGAKGLTEGSAVTVRITRSAQGGKGPRLSARVAAEAGSGLGLVRRGPDPIERFGAAHPDAAILVDDLALLARLRPRFGERVAHRRTVFGDALLTEIEALANPVVDLANGPRLSIHPLPALTAIDVDAGAAVGGKGGEGDRHSAINRAVIPALARQIRLRNLSGAIVIDLAGMPIRRRAALGPTLAAALADDPLRPRFLGFSALGLAEVLRGRVHPPLHEMLCGPHAAGLAALRAVAARVAAMPGRMPVLRASPAVVSALRADTAALEDLARRGGEVLDLRSDPALGDTGWNMDDRNG